MNTITRNTALAAIAAAALTTFGALTPAHAGEATYEYPQPAVSTVTRAEVRAQLLQARRDGTLLASEADFQRSPVFTASRSRAEVQAEARAAAAATHNFLGEPHDFAVVTPSPAQATVLAAATR